LGGGVSPKSGGSFCGTYGADTREKIFKGGAIRLRYLVAHLVLAVSFLPFITSSYAGVPFGDRSVAKMSNPGWTAVAYYGNYTTRIGNTTDAFGTPMPRVEPLHKQEIPFLSDWATEPYSTPTPRVEPLHKQKIPFLSDWATEPYGTPTPRVCKSDWVTLYGLYGPSLKWRCYPGWTHVEIR